MKTTLLRTRERRLGPDYQCGGQGNGACEHYLEQIELGGRGDDALEEGVGLNGAEVECNAGERPISEGQNEQCECEEQHPAIQHASPKPMAAGCLRPAWLHDTTQRGDVCGRIASPGGRLGSHITLTVSARSVRYVVGNTSYGPAPKAPGPAEGVGFEPTEACASLVFKTSTFVRSVTPPNPYHVSRIMYYDSSQGPLAVAAEHFVALDRQYELQPGSAGPRGGGGI